MYTKRRVIIESIQPTGHTRYRNVRLFGSSGYIKYTHTNLSTHINTNVETVGIIALPIPFNEELKTSFTPQIKYVLETIIIFCCAYDITIGDVEIIDENSFEKIADREPKVAPKAIAIKQAFFIDSFTLSYLRAPIFCDTFTECLYS